MAVTLFIFISQLPNILKVSPVVRESCACARIADGFLQMMPIMGLASDVTQDQGPYYDIPAIIYCKGLTAILHISSTVPG